MGCTCEKSIKVEEYQNPKSVNKEDKSTSKNKDLNNNTKKENLENKDLLNLRINKKKENNNEIKETLSNGKLQEKQNENWIKLDDNTKDKNSLKNGESPFNEDKIIGDKDKELSVIKDEEKKDENILKENKEKNSNDQINQKGDKIRRDINENENSKKEIVNMSDEKKEYLNENKEEEKEKEEIQLENLEDKNNEMNPMDNENAQKNETQEEKNLKKDEDIINQNLIINQNQHNKESIFQECNTIKEEEIKLKEKEVNQKNNIAINENDDIPNKEQYISQNKKELNEEEKEKQEKNEDNIDEINKDNKKEEDYNIMEDDQKKLENNVKNINDNINEGNPNEESLEGNINKDFDNQDDNNKIQKEENTNNKKQENVEELKILNNENKEENKEENKVENIIEKKEEKEEDNIKDNEAEQKENINDDRKGQENNVNEKEEQKENFEEKNEEKKEEISYENKKLEEKKEEKFEEKKENKTEERKEEKIEEGKDKENIEENKGEKMEEKNEGKIEEEKKENIEDKKIEENIKENNKENIKENDKEAFLENIEENTKENDGNKEEEKMKEKNEENNKEKEEGKKEKIINNENSNIKNEKESLKENNKNNDIKPMEEAKLLQNDIIPLKENEIGMKTQKNKDNDIIESQIVNNKGDENLNDNIIKTEDEKNEVPNQENNNNILNDNDKEKELNRINEEKDNNNNNDNTKNNDNQNKINNLEENKNNEGVRNENNQEKLDITKENKEDNIKENTNEEKENIAPVTNENQCDEEKEEETILKEDDEIFTSHEHEEIIQKLNTDNLKNIAKKAPKRTKTKIADLITYLNKSTNQMNEFEKGYTIFYWIHENIEYDIAKKRTGKAENRPAEIYKIGKCVCEGYSRLYEYIGQQLGLKVYYINGYVVDTEYKDKYERHAWNVLEVDKKYYLIDATWGAGSSIDNKYTKDFKEFYFCSNPEYFIFSHFPRESKWQLLKSPIGSEDFENRVKFGETFFKYFKGSSVLHNLIITKNEYIIRLYKKNIEVNISATIMIYRGSYYTSVNDCKEIIDEKENYIDIKCIFTEKNHYKVKIYVKIGEIQDFEKGLSTKFKTYMHVVTYKVEYLGEEEKQFKYGEINNKKSNPLEHDEIIANLNKEKIKSIINKSPNRKNSSLNDFIQYLKNETKDLTDFEKAYSLFFWVSKNISYGFCDINKGDDYDNIYKQGKLYIDFSKTFSYILKNIGLNIFEIDGFSKNDSDYHDSDIIFGSNSSLNIIEIKGSYYIIYPSLYLFHFQEEDLIDFYFCAKPENFIFNFLPKIPKWQLLEKSVTKEEFQKRAKLHHLFFNYFDSIEPIYSTITVEKRYTVKLNKKNQQNKIYCTIMGLEAKKNKWDNGPSYLENLNCKCMVIDKEDHKEIKCIFKKLGKFMLIIRANDGSSDSYLEITNLYFECISCLNNKEFDFFREDYNERKKSKKDSLPKPNPMMYFGFYKIENYNVG